MMTDTMTNLLIGSKCLMDFVPIVVTNQVGTLVPGPDTGAEVDPCNIRNGINISAYSRGRCNAS